MGRKSSREINFRRIDVQWTSNNRVRTWEYAGGDGARIKTRQIVENITYVNVHTYRQTYMIVSVFVVQSLFTVQLFIQKDIVCVSTDAEMLNSKLWVFHSGYQFYIENVSSSENKR